jgi:thiol-disulfide isomerase/thioredoxin
MMLQKNITLVVVLVLIIGAIVYMGRGKVGPGNISTPVVDVVSSENVLGDSMAVKTKDKEISPPTKITAKVDTTKARVAMKAMKYERAKEITTPDGFINSNNLPITISQYVGKKVVLLDIWTYSCINCVRTLPYLNDWYTKYEDKGLVIIGLHTPEFDFEKNYDNVKAAVEKYGIKFPVVLDNDYSTWTAYQNRYWPRKYLIDIDGFIRHDHIGEGGYSETEKQIQELLKERAEVLGVKADVELPVTDNGSAPGIFGQSPETYFGSARNEFLANGKRGQAGIQEFTLPEKFSPNGLFLSGSWNMMPEYAESDSLKTSIVYEFNAKKVFLVASSDISTNVEVLVEGKALGSAKGDDVKTIDGKDILTVSNSRLYSIYSGESAGQHKLELKISQKGFKAFAFTFGN